MECEWHEERERSDGPRARRQVAGAEIRQDKWGKKETGKKTKQSEIYSEVNKWRQKVTEQAFAFSTCPAPLSLSGDGASAKAPAVSR